MHPLMAYIDVIALLVNLARFVPAVVGRWDARTPFFATETIEVVLILIIVGQAMILPKVSQGKEVRDDEE